MSDLRELTRAWIADDPDPVTRAAAERMLAAGDEAALRDCFGARLEFGTAGLRGALGPGPNRMNRALVRRVSAGLADVVNAYAPDAATRGVVVGFDGRHGSVAFAGDTARVLAGRGLRVYLYEDTCPTPELAHAVTALGCAAGVMVTASHNPPQDNGYKAYWDDGAQIIPPWDARISQAIDAIPSLRDVAVPELDALRAAGAVRSVPPEVLEAYLDKVLALRVHPGGQVRIAYTAMHGVGTRLVRAVLGRAGHDDLHVVAAQEHPDGDFPTVAFPNPEEPGALDLGLALASRVDADILCANDPDADRLAVAVRTGKGAYRALTGNQVGVLLAADLLAHGPQHPDRLVATSIVSSTLLSRIAAAHGVKYAETLTGFKWIASAAIAHGEQRGAFVMGYEEALGYSIGPVVRDKDGVSALLVLADLAAWCKARGETLLDRLEALYREFGYHATAQKSFVLPGAEGAARIREIMVHLRAHPVLALPGTHLVRITDVASGTTRDLVTGAVAAIGLPPADVLALDYADGLRVLARPSGTEPKIKFYFEVRVPVPGTMAEAEAAAAARLAEVRDAFVAAATS